MERPSWDDTFITMCYVMASRSPDLSTKVGAIITTLSNELVSAGYNGLPRGMDQGIETDACGIPKRLSPQNGMKYLYTEHSERNAIYNAGRNGVPLLNCKLYVNFLPCADCARAITQSGIVEVITHTEGQKAFYETRGDGPNQWKESHDMVLDMFDETGVTHRWHSCKLIQPTAFFSGQQINL